MASPISVDATAVKLNGIKTLTNAIRNGKTPISIKTAEALESVQNDLGKVAGALQTLTVTIAPTPTSDNLVTINGVTVTY